MLLAKMLYKDRTVLYAPMNFRALISKSKLSEVVYSDELSPACNYLGETFNTFISTLLQVSDLNGFD